MSSVGGVSTSYSEYVTDRKLRGADAGVQQAASSSVLPAIKNVEVRRDGDVRWLAVDAPVAEVWQRIIDFWQDSGILMVEQDPGVGIMRTSWLENRANISRDFITDTFRKVLDGFYEAGTRDQYRVRLERAENGGTEVYLTHYGMEEQVLKGSTGDVERTVWVPRERDPGLEVGALAHDLLRAFGVVPEARVLDETVQLGEPLLRGIPVKDASSAGPYPARSRRRWPRSRHAWECSGQGSKWEVLPARPSTRGPGRRASSRGAADHRDAAGRCKPPAAGPVQ